MQLRSPRTLVGIVLLLALLLAGASCVRHPRGGAMASEILRVGVYDNPPKIYTGKDGRPAGLFVELLDAIARQEGWRLEYHACTWAECIRQLQAGQLDLMPDVAYTPARGQQFDFHQVPVTHFWSQLFRRPGIPINSFEDLAGRRIALLKGSYQQDELGQLLRGFGVRWTLVPCATYDEVFRVVRAGHADAAVANNFLATRAIRDFGLQESPLVFSPASLYFATRKGTHARVLARIDVWLGHWQQDRNSVYFQALDHALAPKPLTVLPDWLSPTLVITAGLLLVLVAFNAMLRWRVRKAMTEVHHNKAKLELVLDVSPVALFLAHEDENGDLRLDWASPNIERLYGFTLSRIFRPGWWWEQVHPEDLPTLEPSVALMRKHASVAREYRFLDIEGRTHHLHETLRRLPAETGQPLRMLISWIDQSEAKAHADALLHVAHHDGLTNLPNRELLQLYLGDLLHGSDGFAVAVIDLDRLRGINDTLGHATGDQVLRAAAQRLQAWLPERGFLARVGGDEFAVVLPAGPAGADVDAFARDVLDAFAQPLLGNAGTPTVITVSIGIARFPSDGDDTDTLLQHAELALYEAKRQGPSHSRHFDPALSAGAAQRHALENGLRHALANQQLALHYQPQVDLKDGRMAGVEALLRWQHPEWGMVPPAQFIPVAEASGLIEEIGQWALREACRQLREWDAAGVHVASMAVNCSVQQLDATRLPAVVAEALQATGISADRLELEITESMLMKDPEHAVTALQALKSQGIRIAIDDFGTGYSSLAYLRRLPVDRLKIDRAFVNGIGHDPGDEQICRTVIALAQNLGLDTLAEGVEHPHEAEFLRAGGCALAQGYHFARPLPATALAEWLQQPQARALP